MMNEKGICLTLNVEQRENITGGTSGENSPSRQVPSNIHKIIQPLCDNNTKNIDQQGIGKDRGTTEVTTPISSVKLTTEERVNM